MYNYGWCSRSCPMLEAVRGQEVEQARETGMCEWAEGGINRRRTAPSTHPHIWPTYSIEPRGRGAAECLCGPAIVLLMEWVSPSLSLWSLKSRRNALLVPVISWPNDFTTLESAELYSQYKDTQEQKTERAMIKQKGQANHLSRYWWYSTFKILSDLTCDKWWQLWGEKNH